MAIMSKGIKLFYKDRVEEIWNEVEGLQEIPELGNAEPDYVEVTTLNDSYHTYEQGLGNYADTLAFKFIYSYQTFNTLPTGDNEEWKVEMPEGESCSFTGIASTKLDGVGAGAALTFTLNIKPTSVFIWDSI